MAIYLYDLCALETVRSVSLKFLRPSVLRLRVSECSERDAVIDF